MHCKLLQTLRKSLDFFLIHDGDLVFGPKYYKNSMVKLSFIFVTKPRSGLGSITVSFIQKYCPQHIVDGGNCRTLLDLFWEQSVQYLSKIPSDFPRRKCIYQWNFVKTKTQYLRIHVNMQFLEFRSCNLH